MKRISAIWLVAIPILLGVSSCKNEKKEPILNLTQEVLFEKEGTAVLKKAETDSIVATLDIEIADDDYQHQTGLMYRTGMVNDQAMLFIFESEEPRSFYMKNTEFPLDIIYLNKEKQIINIRKNAQPLDETSLPSDAPAMYVLEINAGLSDVWGLAAGDLLEWKKL
ncbi:MAG: DUF192 domain-containing protein [Flavobacteriaceae bacterium]|nr:DUF192 domain-containing protein [Flavobacteriaceae bacterium]